MRTTSNYSCLSARSGAATVPSIVSATTPPPIPPAYRSWLWALAACSFGLGLYWYDDWSAKINELILFWVFGGLELVIMGPGMAVLAYLLSEQFRLKDQRYRERLVQEREKRFRFLGRIAASMAHEIRNPLHNVHLLTDELRSHVAPGAGDLVDRINRNLERLDQANLLIYELAKPSRRIDVDGGPIDVPLLIDEVLKDEWRNVSPAVRLEHRRPSVPTLVIAPVPGLRIVLRNLLRNAIEATTAGPVAIDYHRTAGSIEVRIRNPGSVPDFLMMEEEDVESQKPNGMGIGVSIARHLAVLYGGRLEFTAEADHVVTHLHLIAGD